MSSNEQHWPTTKLGDLFEISSSKRVLQNDWKGEGVPFYRAREIVRLANAGSVENELFISEAHFSSLAEKFGAPEPGDIMVSAVGTLGACYVVKEGDRFYFKDASVLRLRPKQSLCTRYFWHVFQTQDLKSQINATSGSTVGTLTIARAQGLDVPLPPLDEQKRIAAILDKADALRAKRRQAIALLDSLTQSIFLEMFGDPVSNPKGWEVSPLNETADFISGGTPSKSSPSYWTGLIPWVSPKDMKSVVIADAIDHISESAVQQSAVKLVAKDTILIVVRGMILAHSVPIAILSRSAAFNQDIKGVRFHSRVEPHYGLWNLLSLRSHILKEVASAAHGTKRIDMDVISKLPVLRAPVSMQKAFKDRCEHIIRDTELMREAEKKTAENFENLQSALFSSGAKK